MDVQAHIRNLLRNDWTAARIRNPAFSLRAFSRRIGLQASAVSEILSGKRSITRKMALRILKGLAVSPAEVQKVLRAYGPRERPLIESAGGARILDYSRIDMDQFHVIADWYYFAILSLADTSGFRGEPGWVAKRLGIKIPEARVALERLERLEMLSRRADGTLGPTGKQFETSADVTHLSLRRHHVQNLDLARRALEQDELHEREFTFISMATDPIRMPEIKKRIRAFRDELCAEFENGAREQVYRMCIQFFPLTKRESGEVA